MNMVPSRAVELAAELKPLVENADPDVEVVFCVPAIDLVPVGQIIAGSSICLGAENMYHQDRGAYTGETSAEMLTDIGVKYVILGHSERRGYFGETDVEIGRKMKQALANGITPILCCGESLEQRELGIAFDWVHIQIKIAYRGISAEQAAQTVIAYEPIWAIGTGKTATSSQAQEICADIRACLREMYDDETAEAIRILYGGSVNEDNADNLFNQPDIDGGLVGGASLKTDFAKIVHFREIAVR